MNFAEDFDDIQKKNIPEKVFSFKEQLGKSEGIALNKDYKKLLLEILPNSIDIVKASLKEDKKGTDWWVKFRNKNQISIDIKARDIDPLKLRLPEDDLILEIWSNIERQIPGWTLDINKRTDYILWFWKPTGRFLLLSFPKLLYVFKENWKKWKEMYTSRTNKSKGSDGTTWESEYMKVPRKVVLKEIDRIFHGESTSY